MSLQEFFGRCEEQARTINASGAWSRWTAAQPALAQMGSAVDLCDVVMDRAEPAQANDLLLALVRAGSVDGGVDQRGVTQRLPTSCTQGNAARRCLVFGVTPGSTGL